MSIWSTLEKFADPVMLGGITGDVIDLGNRIGRNG